MATDYDAPRRAKGEDEPETESIEEVRAAERKRAGQQTDVIETEDLVSSGDFTLPGADLSNEMLEVEVTPQQAGEFVCSSCFLVKAHTQLANPGARSPLCIDCA